MIKLNQKGVAHIAGLLVLLLGLGAGIYLVQQSQVFKPQAGNKSIVFKSSTGEVITSTSSPTVKIELTSPLGPATGSNNQNRNNSGTNRNSVTTVSYRITENSPSEFSKNKNSGWLPYTQTPTVIDYTFKDTTPGNKFIWVEFKGSNGRTDRQNARITLLPASASPNPSPNVSPSPIPSAFGKSIKFNNDNTSNPGYAKVTTTKLATGNPFTIEGWLKTDKPSSGEYIRASRVITYTNPQVPFVASGYIFSLPVEVQERSDVSGRFDLGFNALVSTVSTHNGNSPYISARTPYSTGLDLQPNTWYHFAATSYSEGARCYVKLYIDGKLVKSAERVSSDSTRDCQISTDRPQNLVFAKHLDSEGGIAGYYYSGELDEVRISKGIRYTSDFTPQRTPFSPDADTLVLYHFDGNGNDSSSNSLNLEVLGNVQFVQSTIPSN